MADGEITTEIQRFIARYIESVEKLEILLTLHREPDKAWSVQEVYQKIQSSLPSIAKELRDLSGEGFLQKVDDCFRYRPKSDELNQRVFALDAAYQKRHVKIIGLIFSKSTDDLRKFADAFRIRKGNE
ncbi:MAG: hypothetical protein ABIV39_07785 [Verrucomicrobiota bacterium]